MVSKKKVTIGAGIAAVILYFLWPRYIQASSFSVTLTADKTSVLANDSTAAGTITFTLQAANTSKFPLQYTIWFRSPNPGTLITWNNATTLGPFNAGSFSSWTIRGTFVLYATCSDASNITATSPPISFQVI